MTESDFIVDRMGSIVGITPMNQAAREWLTANCQAEDWQWQNATLNIDGRMAPEILEGMTAAGLTVES